ncbi:phage distal tail protein [Glutamicibacter sp. NPDC087583]|uniref:phage distal tail protein n=1 Tax=Glutamicibacter sp. NPDC087583 TaxID=3363995 RepID=UPI00381218E7
MSHLYLVNSKLGTLRLDGMLSGIEATQVVEGLTGTGLPPVEVRWNEGAGDGSAYAGHRVLARDIDVPLMLTSATAQGLQDRMSELASFLDPRNGATSLRYSVDPESMGNWLLIVHRIAGGTWAHTRDAVRMEDEFWVEFIVTLRAGDPYWRKTEPTTLGWNGSSYWNIPVGGDAATWPIWTLTGPATALRLTSPDGANLHWRGELAAGQSLTINAQKHSIWDSSGRNRYAELDPSPRFKQLHPGDDAWNISRASTGGSLTVEFYDRRWAII